MNKLVTQFLQLRCAGDVINSVAPVHQMEKEISEAMALRQWLKGYALKRPMTYTVYDLCAGNGLVGALAAYTLPVKKVVAIDKKKRKRPWDTIRGFEYRVQDIRNGVYGVTNPRRESTTIDVVVPHRQEEQALVVSSHPCGEMAEVVLKLAYHANQPVAILTCCVENGGLLDAPWTKRLRQKVGGYEAWSIALAQKYGGSVVQCATISPANLMVKVDR